ncbi:SlyX family protein [Alcaligenaceae bacterium]|nr:SlyX family protein [Alcaligenaceae bacterium]
MTLEERLVEIELKLTAQEDLVQTLNEQVYQQQKQLSEFKALCAALVKRLGEVADDSGAADAYTQERPPHY